MASSKRTLACDSGAVSDNSDSTSSDSDNCSNADEDGSCDLHGSLGAVVGKYRADVDGLRAVAVISVIVYHMNERWLPGGFTGVDVFFVISGYVVTGSLLSHLNSSVSDFLCGFYARRIKRLTPALLLMIGVSGLVLAVTEPPDIPHLDDYFVAAACAVCGVANLFFARLSQQGDGGYWDQMTGKDRADANPFVHTWSLGVEEQFYLFFPLLLMLVHRRPRAKSWGALDLEWPAPVPALAACAALSVCVSWWMTQRAPDLAFYTLPARFWELAAGAIVAEVEASGRSCWPAARGRAAALAAQLLALLLLGWSFWFVTPEAMGFPFPGAALPVAGAVCFIVAGESDESFLNHKIIGGTVPVYIGKLSYPLYLWHWPVRSLAMEFELADSASPAGCLVLTSITFALSALTYHFVEAGFRSWRPGRHQSVFAALLPAALALVACLLLLSLPPLRTPLYERALTLSSPGADCLQEYDLLKTPHIQLPDTGCACTRVPAFLHAPPAAVSDSRPDLPSCLDLSFSAYPVEQCWASFKHCDGWWCQRSGDCKLPLTDPLRRCTREQNVSKALAELVARSPCLKPGADHQRRPVLFLLGDSHSKMLFRGLSLALRGKFDIHAWAAVRGKNMIKPGSKFAGVRSELQRVVAANLRPGDVVAFCFHINSEHDRANQKTIDMYFSFLEEWSAIVNSTGAALIAFGDNHPFPSHTHRCRAVIQPSFCFPSRSEVMRSPVLEAMRGAKRGWLYFEVEGLFCDRELCSPFIPETNCLAYGDLHHLGQVGSAYLAPFICSFFREHGLFDGVAFTDRHVSA